MSEVDETSATTRNSWQILYMIYISYDNILLKKIRVTICILKMEQYLFKEQNQYLF